MNQQNLQNSLEKPTFWSIPLNELPPTELAIKSAELVQRLIKISERFQDVRFATSLAAEDMVVTDAIKKANVKIKLFTLATVNYIKRPSIWLAPPRIITTYPLKRCTHKIRTYKPSLLNME